MSFVDHLSTTTLDLLCLVICSLILIPSITHTLETALLIRNHYKPDKLPLNDGTENFTELVFFSDLLVDKSLFIKDFVEDDGKVYLISCPRRWGKSVNMDMLRTFLQYQVHAYDGELMLPIPKTNNYRLFMNGEIPEANHGTLRRLKGPLLISKHKKFVTEHLGKHPVIQTYLFSDGENMSTFLLSVQVHVQVAFDDHRYLVTKYKHIMQKRNWYNDTKTEARQLYLKYFKYWFDQTPLNTTELIESFVFLSEMLWRHWEKKVYLFMDAYYSPWERAFRYKYINAEERKEFLDFYVKFMKATFIDNPYLEKGIIFGRNAASVELFQVLPNLTECNLMTGKFMEYFSYNQYDMKAQYDFLKTPITTQQQIDYWYKGYKVNNRDLTIYSVESICKYFGRGEFKKFWINSGGMYHFMRAFLQISIFKQKFLSLLNGTDLVVTLDRGRFTWSDYDVLMGAQKFEDRPGDEYVDKGFMFLYELGYLTLSQDYDMASKTYTYHLRIPNREIKGDMKFNLYKYWDAPPVTGLIFRFDNEDCDPAD